MTKYSKIYLALNEQLALLTSRGLEISNLDAAETYLARVGYYQLSAY